MEDGRTGGRQVQVEYIRNINMWGDAVRYLSYRASTAVMPPLISIIVQKSDATLTNISTEVAVEAPCCAEN